MVSIIYVLAAILNNQIRVVNLAGVLLQIPVSYDHTREIFFLYMTHRNIFHVEFD